MVATNQILFRKSSSCFGSLGSIAKSSLGSTRIPFWKRPLPNMIEHLTCGSWLMIFSRGKGFVCRRRSERESCGAHHDGVEPHLLPIGKHDLLVRTPEDAPQAGLGRVRLDEVVRVVPLLTVYCGVGDRERKLGLGLC